MENFFPSSVSIGFTMTGITGILAAPLLAILWRKRPHTRWFPFLVGFSAWRTYEKIPPTYGASASSY